MANSNFRIGKGGKRPDEPWFTIGSFDVNTSAFAALLGAMSIVLYALSKPTVLDLAMLPASVRRGQIWRLVTWPLANLQVDVWLVVGVFLIYWFGRDVERLIGRVRMAQLLLLVVVVGAATAFILDTPLAGVRLIEHACLVAFAVEYPRAQFFFGIPARIVALIVIGIDVVRYLGDRYWQGVAITFAVVAAVLLALRAMGLAVDLAWVPKLPVLGGKATPRTKNSSPRGAPAKAKTAKPSRRSKADLRIVETSSRPSDSPRGTASGIDALLDKISAHGIESLTPEERRQLEQTSNRLRDEKK